MGSIQIMDTLLSNKIAAGEVVERPSSVVKELVENAIDAGSTAIDVFLTEAGLSEIRVIDNGKGMDRADAELSFARHATSKVFQEHDLFRIRTLGFRGEALASIASVSKVRLQTSNGETGTLIELEGGQIVTVQDASLRQGTDISIRQLFFNTPARLKYVKTIQTELSHSLDLLNRLALCYPNIAFSVQHNDQQLMRTSGRGDLLQVIASIYGVATAKKMASFEATDADFKVSGYLSYPEINRASKNYLTIFVNGRWVKNFNVNRSAIVAYHTFLPIERFPIVVLHIEGDPMLTDVNVHPAKHEIRLSKEKELLELIEATMRKTITSLYRIPEVVEPVKKPTLVTPTIEEKPKQSTQLGWWSKEEPKVIKETIVPPPVVTKQEIQPVTEEIIIEQQEKAVFPQLEVIGQIHGTYIVAQSADGFYLIDQHAAQERIKYEYFREKVGQVNAQEKQPLLIPISMQLTSNEYVVLQERKQLLEDVGITIEDFGVNTFIVREHPTWFPKGQEESIIQDMIRDVLAKKSVSVAELREEAAIMMSCKKSIKANHYLQRIEMEQLLVDLKNAEQPYTCPHGRPVIVHFSAYELEKMFKRSM